MTSIKLARQGDILIERIDALPAGLTEAKRDDIGRIVLARGESHDHSHALRAKNVCGFSLAGSEDVDYTEVGGAGVVLTHEYSSGAMADHHPVDLAPGVYKITRQREYSAPGIVRRVVD